MNRVIEQVYFESSGLVYRREVLETGGESETLIGMTEYDQNEGTEEQPVMVHYRFDFDSGQYVRVD